MNPNEDRVLIKPIPAKTKTTGGLYIPDEAQKIALWEVVKIGPTSTDCAKCGTKRVTDLKEGMLVLINDNAGLQFEYGQGDQKQMYKVIRFMDIHGFDEKVIEPLPLPVAEEPKPTPDEPQ